jgi:hypothetical protein
VLFSFPLSSSCFGLPTLFLLFPRKLTPLFTQSEICHVVSISSIKLKTSSTPPFTFPYSPSELTASSDLRLVELPTCPVCLETLDSRYTGLVQIPCSHEYHAHCLLRWGDSRCVYALTLPSRFIAARRTVVGFCSGRVRSPFLLHPDVPSAVPPTPALVGTPSPPPTRPITSAPSVKARQTFGSASSVETSVGAFRRLASPSPPFPPRSDSLLPVLPSYCSGRYQGGHAHSHFGETGHSYSLELE